MYIVCFCFLIHFLSFIDVSVHTAHSERHASRSHEPSGTSPPLEAGTLFSFFISDTNSA